MLRSPLLTVAVTAVVTITSAGCQKADPTASLAAEREAAPDIPRPFLLKHEPERQFSSVAASGDLIYLVVQSADTTQAELRVYDASLVTNPKRVASLGALKGSDLALSGSRAYLYETEAGGQTVIDLAQPRAPAPLLTANDQTKIFAAATLLPTANQVFAVAGAVVTAIDVSSVETPTETWRLEVPSTDTAGAALTGDGKTLCLAASGDDHRILVSLAVGGRKPTDIGTLIDSESDERSGEMATIGSFAYFLNQGLRIADVSDPAEPTLVDRMTRKQVFDSGSQFYGLTSDAERLYIVGESALVVLTPDANGRLTVSLRVEGIAEIAGGQLNRDLAVGAKAAYLLSERGDLLVVPLIPRPL